MLLISRLEVALLFLQGFVVAAAAAFSSDDDTIEKLDCGIRQLAMDYAKELRIISNVDVCDNDENHDNDMILEAVHDALRLSELCPKNDQTFLLRRRRPNHETVDTNTSDSHSSTAELCSNTNETLCYFVESPTEIDERCKNGTNEDERCQKSTLKQRDGSVEKPFKSVHEAMDTIRLFSFLHGPSRIVLYLRSGVHYLQGRPLKLSSIATPTKKQTLHLTIKGYPGEDVWISGGVNLKNVQFFKCDSSTNDDGTNIRNQHRYHHHDGVYVADLSSVLKNEGWDHQSLPKTPSLFTSKRRYIRARYPNGDPEINQWGYATPDRYKYCIGSDKVVEWTKPKPGRPPTFTYIDFEHNPPDGVPVKNNSAMEDYNLYASGKGGVCSEVWGDSADSYWCSNASAGGWSEVDQDCAVTGQMQIPVGMAYNRSSEVLRPFQQDDVRHGSSFRGGIVQAWHSQSWALHMFEITNHFPGNGTMVFAKGGGSQGGRNWCRCDQCTYAAQWCGQHQDPPNNNDERLIGGDWMIENVKYFLDQPSEYFFDKNTFMLYVKPNSTEDLHDLSLGLLTELIDLRNAINVNIENISFRDQASTYMEDGWSAPSGGDWSLRRGGGTCWNFFVAEKSFHVAF